MVMKKFIKVFVLFFLCFTVAYLFREVAITGFVLIKLLCYSAVIGLAFVFVTSEWWKKNVLKLKR